MFELISLKPKHAPDIAKLEMKLYPPRLRLGEAVHKANLEMFEKNGKNFSVGLTENNRLVGYILGWPQETLAEGHDEEVVLMEDMAIIPEHKNRFHGMLAAFIEQIHLKQYGNRAIEGVARRKAFHFWKKHRKVMRELGYEIRNTEGYFDEEIFEDMVWIRVLPVD